MLEAATSGWVAEQIAVIERRREKDVATRRAAITGVSTHPDVFEEELPRPAPDYAALRAAAAGRLAQWRRGRSDEDPCAALRAAVARRARGSGDLMAASVAAARRGATIGELTVALAGPAAGREGARTTPLAVRPYAAAYEQLRDLVDAYAAGARWRASEGLSRPAGRPQGVPRARHLRAGLRRSRRLRARERRRAVHAQAAACAASGAVDRRHLLERRALRDRRGGRRASPAGRRRAGRRARRRTPAPTRPATAPPASTASSSSSATCSRPSARCFTRQVCCDKQDPRLRRRAVERRAAGRQPAGRLARPRGGPGRRAPSTSSRGRRRRASPLKPLYTSADLDGLETPAARCPASRRSCAVPTPRCTSGGPGRCGSTPGSRPPRSPTPSTGATWRPGRRA